MAETKLHNYSVQEKLNKMDIDVITISATLTSLGEADDIMFINTPIPNAVAVNGGACMIHSITAIVGNDATDADSVGSEMTSSFRLVFTNDSTSVGAVEADIGAVTLSRAIVDGTQGFVDMTAAQDLGLFALYSKNSVGIVAKAESDSRDLYVYGITQSTDDFDGGTITLNIGVVKD
tara:strand:+ start:670 stop:1200 length:531 start_codon:yes stop_codon:yes gene_type:complete